MVIDDTKIVFINYSFLLFIIYLLWYSFIVYRYVKSLSSILQIDKFLCVSYISNFLNIRIKRKE